MGAAALAAASALAGAPGCAGSVGGSVGGGGNTSGGAQSSSALPDASSQAYAPSDAAATSAHELEAPADEASTQGDAASGALQASFAILSDLHVSADFQPGVDHLHAALDAIAGFDPFPDAVIVNGDLTNRGTPDEYELVRSIVAQHGLTIERNFICSMGNHEQYNDDWVNDAARYHEQRQRFAAFCGRAGVYTSLQVAGQRLVMLGPDVPSQTHWAHFRLSDTQLAWLDGLLARDSQEGQRTFVFLHIPLDNTVAYTLEGDYGFGGVENAAQLRSVLGRYPRAVLLSGHTHAPWDFVYLDGVGPLCVNDGAVGYARTTSDGQQRDNDASRGLRMLVYADRLEFEAWDFAAGVCVPDAGYTHPAS